MKSCLFGAIVAIGLTLPAFGQSESVKRLLDARGSDPLIGTWKMNLDKSTFLGFQAPKSETLNWTGEGQTLIDTINGVDTQGRASKQVNIHIYDGMPYPTTGNPTYNASAYTRNGNTINVTRFKNGKPVGFGQATIDPGKTYTFTVAGIANNQPYYAVIVYDRQ